MKKALKIILAVIVALVLVVALLVVGLNVFKRAILPEYYEIKTDLAGNDGLGDGYVPQDITSYVYGDSKMYLTCGYVTKNRPSRIYLISAEEDTTYFELVDESQNPIYDAFEGISIYENYVIVSGNSKLFFVNLKDILDPEINEVSEITFNSETTNYVSVEKSVNLEIDADFLYADIGDASTVTDDVLYIGEYVDNSKAGTLVNDNSTYYSARVRCYSLPALLDGKLEVVYSYLIRDNVEGFAIGNNKIVLVVASGFSYSHYYVYDIPTYFDDGSTYFLDDRYLIRDIKGPTLATGLDFDGEKFISLFQSASNKYIIGKFFFANKIIGLDIK